MPDHNLPLNQIIHGECVSVLNTLPAGSIDLIFADPPYNLQLQQELWRPNMTKVDAVTDDWDRFDSLAAYDAFTRDWLTACRRVLSDRGTLWVIGSYHNIFRIGTLLMDLDFWILNQIQWIKTNPMPNFRGTRFTNAQETLIWAQPQQGAPYTFNYHSMKALNGGKQMRSDWLLPIASGSERIRINGQKAHSTQKPEALLYRIILASSKPADVVLDPFSGSGTTAAVAKRLHRNYIGIERDQTYVNVARDRLAAVEPDTFTEFVFDPEPQRRKRVRVSFGALVERGLIKPGAPLYFKNNPAQQAVVLASGQIEYNGAIASIHKTAKAIQNAPCNGWDHWYIDGPDGERIVIDALREIVRRELENAHEN